MKDKYTKIIKEINNTQSALTNLNKNIKLLFNEIDNNKDILNNTIINTVCEYYKININTIVIKKKVKNRKIHMVRNNNKAFCLITYYLATYGKLSIYRIALILNNYSNRICHSIKYIKELDKNTKDKYQIEIINDMNIIEPELLNKIKNIK